MVVVTMTNNMVGRSRGRVMCRNRCQLEAPSMAAASCSITGTDCNPARKMIIAVPKLRQEAIAISEGIAHVVDPSQSGPWMPTQPRMVLNSPTSCRSRKRQTTATATITVTTGGVVTNPEERAEPRDPLVQGHRSGQRDAQRQRDANNHEVGRVVRGLPERAVTKDVGVVLKPHEANGER